MHEPGGYQDIKENQKSWIPEFPTNNGQLPGITGSKAQSNCDARYI